jgi:hypothetical protein
LRFGVLSGRQHLKIAWGAVGVKFR